MLNRAEIIEKARQIKDYDERVEFLAKHGIVNNTALAMGALEMEMMDAKEERIKWKIKEMEIQWERKKLRLKKPR